MRPKEEMKKLIPLVALLFSGCSSDDPTIVEGVIVDGITKQPVENVKIVAGEDTGGLLDLSNPETPSSASAFSKSDGTYLLDIGASRTAETYSLLFSKEKYCGRFLQAVRASKINHINIEMYKSVSVELIYNLNDKADSMVQGLSNINMVFDEGQCEQCFGGFIGEEFCTEKLVIQDISYRKKRPWEEWNEIEYSFEGLQGFNYTLWYELYAGQTLLKRDTLEYTFNKSEFTIEINL